MQKSVDFLERRHTKECVLGRVWDKERRVVFSA